MNKLSENVKSVLVAGHSKQIKFANEFVRAIGSPTDSRTVLPRAVG